MIAHIDRVPTYPGRVTLTPVAGQPNKYDMVRADEPTQAGMPMNKIAFDELLAASGVTTGTASALTLTQAGFALADGACVRFRLHVAPTAPTLNVNGTGAKPIVTSRGKPFKGASVGSWVTVVYSVTMDSFTLQGEGGANSKYQSNTFLGLMGYTAVLKKEL